MGILVLPKMEGHSIGGIGKTHSCFEEIVEIVEGTALNNEVVTVLGVLGIISSRTVREGWI